MDARELRIGNYVSINNPRFFEEIKNIPLRVKSITELPDFISVGIHHFIGEDYHDYHQKNCFVEPISLTEEWLLKFGFEKHHKEYYNDVMMLNPIKSSNNEYEIYFFPAALGSASRGRFQRLYFVHQIQNLYFALTGEELTIKDK